MTDDHIALMNENGIEQSILLVSSSEIYFGDGQLAGDVAHHVNDAGVSTARKHQGRFEIFASLPLPAGDRALAEMERVHGRDGVAGYLVTSNAGGVYLDEPRYEPPWQALNSRRATFFVHPASPPNRDAVRLGRPEPMVEYPFDSARTFVDLIFASVLLRYPDIRFLATTAAAFCLCSPTASSASAAPLAASVTGRMRSPPASSSAGFGWICAVLPLPTALPTLASVVGTDRLVLGTDYCFAPSLRVTQMMRDLSSHGRGSTETPNICSSREDKRLRFHIDEIWI